jgi:ribose 5-phosphate isomerase A
MTDETPQDQAKIAAGRRAVEEYCQDGMRLGLGSGTTSHFFVRGLAERVRDGLDIVGVPSSAGTRDLALELGVPLVDLDDVAELDLTIDGFDEMDPQGRMIKGGGGCHLWEKIVATASQRMVVVADDTKLVSRLGRFPLPVEVVRFGHVSTTRLLAGLLDDLGYSEVTLTPRMNGNDRLVTDSGNYLVDLHLGQIEHPEELATALNQIPGVVENGLFLGIAREVVIGHPDGTTEIRSLTSG